MPLAPKSFQDIITFSRASTGTFYNSSGYLTTAGILNYLTYSNAPENVAWQKVDSFVQTNLLTYSEQFDNGAWVKTSLNTTGTPAWVNAAVAPDGTTTADFLIPTNGFVTHSVNTVGGTVPVGTNTFSVYAKAGGYNYLQMLWGTGTDYANFNLTGSGSVSQNSGAAPTITAVGNGWYRCTITSTFAASTNLWLMPIITGTELRYPTLTGDGVSGVYVWGAQLVLGAVPGNYQATTAAALPVLYTAYDNTLTARWIGDNTVSNPHGIRQNFTGVAAQTYVVSFYAKAGTMNYAGAWAFGALGSTSGRIFDLVNGTTQSATGFIPTTYGMINAGNGWWRCWFTATSTGGTITAHIGPHNGGGTETYTGTGNGIYITDMQIEVGTSVGPYYETTASQYNAPRFDYDPVTLQPRGLLIEEQRANLLLQSNDFFTSWSPSNITRTLNSILSPSGNVDGVKIEATAAVGTVLYQGAAVAATAATGSVYVKQGTSATIGSTFGIRNQTTATDLVFASINYSTGAVTYIVGSSGVTVTNVGNGWWRIAISATTGITSGDNIRFYVGFSGIVATAGDHFYAYGAQLETVAFATSYIPTVASQVTRAVDSVFLNTLSPWFNQRQGTLYVSASYYSAVPAAGARGGFVGSGPYASANSINIFNGGGTATVDAFFTSTTYPDVNFNRPIATAANAVNKIGFGYNQNNGIYGLSVNASAVTTVTSTQNTATFTSIALGRRDVSTSNLLNGHIQRFSYYPRRLTDAELQAITT